MDESSEEPEDDTVFLDATSAEERPSHWLPTDEREETLDHHARWSARGLDAMAFVVVLLLLASAIYFLAGYVIHWAMPR